MICYANLGLIGLIIDLCILSWSNMLIFVNFVELTFEHKCQHILIAVIVLLIRVFVGSENSGHSLTEP